MKWLLACLAAGVMSACGFAPFNLWPLTLTAYALLLLAVEAAPTLRSALARGWWFGLGQFVLGLNWIATSFTYQSNMPAWLGWIAVVALSLYLAVYPAAAAGLAWRWSGRDRLRLVLLFAASWIVTEYLRAVLFTGFPWTPLGVSLLPTPAAIFATLGGTYGLSGLVVLISGVIYLVARQNWRKGGGLVLAAGALIATALIAAPKPEGEPGAMVRIVQPNVSQEEKHGPGYEPLIAQRLSSLTMQEPREGPRLVLWPEDAMPYILDEDPWAPNQLASWLGPDDLLLTGAAKIERDGTGWAVGARNSVYVLNAKGELMHRYDKAHLVPYGEYLPMRSLLEPLGLARIVPGDLDFWEGPGPQTIALPGFGRVGMQICYEIVFSGQVVDGANRPDFIFNPSNDAWFGWWGPPQHLAQARMRALEEGLPVLRSTPTGISALVDARGNLVASIPYRERGVIDARLPPPAPPTVFARFGNLMPFVFALLLIVAAAVSARLQSRGNRVREPRT